MHFNQILPRRPFEAAYFGRGWPCQWAVCYKKLAKYRYSTTLASYMCGYLRLLQISCICVSNYSVNNVNH